jgi:DNA-binding CsgD family transcriptional regulator
VINRHLPGVDRLTARELHVLQLCANGIRTYQAAEDLGITQKTLRTHRTNILRKMDCSTITEAVAVALRAGRLT